MLPTTSIEMMLIVGSNAIEPLALAAIGMSLFYAENPHHR
jgi:hypothetical protein